MALSMNGMLGGSKCLVSVQEHVGFEVISKSSDLRLDVFLEGELTDPAVLERPANLRWAQRFCVFFPDEKILGVFHDEEVQFLLR